MARVAFVDPESVVVHVDAIGSAIAGEGFAPVLGTVKACPANVNVVSVDGVDLDVAVIHRTRVQGVDPLPRRSAVLRQIDATVIVFVGALLSLQVGRLAAERTGEFVSCARSASLWAFAEFDFDFDFLAIS